MLQTMNKTIVFIIAYSIVFTLPDNVATLTPLFTHNSGILRCSVVFNEINE